MKHILLIVLISLLWGCSTAQLEDMQNTAATLRDNLDTRIAELRTEAQTNDKSSASTRCCVENSGCFGEGHR